PLSLPDALPIYLPRSYGHRLAESQRAAACVGRALPDGHGLIFQRFELGDRVAGFKVIADAVLDDAARGDDHVLGADELIKKGRGDAVLLQLSRVVADGNLLV